MIIKGGQRGGLSHHRGPRPSRDSKSRRDQPSFYKAPSRSRYNTHDDRDQNRFGRQRNNSPRRDKKFRDEEPKSRRRYIKQGDTGSANFKPLGTMHGWEDSDYEE